MKQLIKLKNVQWVKITRPTENDIRDINKEFNIHPLISRELLTPTIRPKVDAYPDYLYMVMHIPVFQQSDRKTYPREIDLILLKNTVITVTYEEVKPLEEFWDIVKRSDSNPHFEKEAGHFLYHLIHHMFRFSLRELDHIQENINTLEDIMFYGGHDQIAKDIYVARRDIIDFRRTLKPQERMLTSLEDAGTRLYGEYAQPFLRNLTSEYLLVWDVLEGHKETIDELYETNESILSSTMNRTMKIFTVLAFLTFIPSLTANIFGMSIATFPLKDNPNAFWIVMGAAVLISLMLYCYYKFRKII